MKKFKITFMTLFLLMVTLLPNFNVNAETMSDEFKSYLNEEGKFVVNSVKPTTIEEFHVIFETLYCDSEGNCSLNPGFDNPDDPSLDFTSTNITYGSGPDKEETHTVSLEYKYDNDTKTVIDEYIKKIPEDKEYFEVSDMEVINYIYNGKGKHTNLFNYSGELKKYINYKNFSIDIRMGMDNLFYNEAGGIASFAYNKTIYGILSGARGTFAKHIIYVPDSTGDTKEELMQAAQKRIDDYIGKDKVKLSYLGTGIHDLYVAEKNRAETKANEIQTRIDALPDGSQEKEDAYQEQSLYWDLFYQCETCIDTFENNTENRDCTFLKEAEGNFYFNAKVFEGTENEADYYFIIVKDSSKMVNPVVKTSDVKTDITITSQDKSIPLDTLISAKKLTSGTEYENIIKALDVKNHETYDLTLSSISTGKNIQTGEFEVKIPISDTLKDKTLIAYYVGDDNKIEEHEVTVKDGYATFTTNHFSIYTLAEKTSSKADSTASNTPVEPTTNNPKTSDNLFTYVGMLFVSTLGVISLSYIYLKNKKKIRNK